MVAPKTGNTEAAKRSGAGARRPGSVGLETPSKALALANVLEEARAAGLLEGEESEHVSFRAPPALVEAVKREAGVTSLTELGLLALALLAQRDPVVSAMRRTRGHLGSVNQLEY